MTVATNLRRAAGGGTGDAGVQADVVGVAEFSSARAPRRFGSLEHVRIGHAERIPPEYRQSAENGYNSQTRVQLEVPPLNPEGDQK